VPRHGATLVETLLVIALIAILAALLVPAIGGVRGSARTAADLSALRQHGVVFQAYGADNAGMAPCRFDPRGKRTQIRTSSGLTIDSGEWGYMTQHRMWSVLLADSYYDGNVFDASFYSSRRTDFSYGDWTDFYWTAVFLAEPKFWDLRTRTGCDQLRGVRFDEVVDPSRKVMHANAATSIGPPADGIADRGLVETERTDFGFCDGSARSVRRHDILGHEGPGLLGDPLARCPETGMGLWSCDYRTVGGMITVRGVRGRDVR
jgi:type II secretory pathway pseudopilin PulG